MIAGEPLRYARRHLHEPVRYDRDAAGHEHKGKGQGGGQFVSTGEGGGGGEAEEAAPEPAARRERRPAAKHHTEPKAAAAAIADEVLSWCAAMAKQGRLPGEIPTRQELHDNWMKVFRSRKAHEGDKPAFKDLNPEQGAAITEAMEMNAGNDAYNAFVDKHGEVAVIYRRAEKGRSAAAEWRGAIHIFDSPFWKGEVITDLQPGEATAGGMCGYAGVIRHEYGHKLFGSLPLERQREWRSLVPHGEVEQGLTSYAAKNAEEAFCEAFTIGTDERYKPGVFPEWVDALIAKQKEWLL